MKWKLRFLELAKTVAQWSKDTTKVGSVAVNSANAILTTGLNGPPRGVKDLPERFERPAKYLYAAHAEENLVAHAARQVLEGSTVFVTHMCCNACARMLINSGVARVCVGDGQTSMPKELFDAALEMFDEAGVILEFLPPSSDQSADSEVFGLREQSEGGKSVQGTPDGTYGNGY
jgi:dCMP deaminase